ncbi:uncharacterized protein CDAR_253811 [Caerostris darwini]|uniref:Uncharacterized protein n=1 Tax=Caerostris darwini TaxID=1538125 RepID=A0AAV4QA46_9ARAC|nr:uncharacterized protein CDAR_253811 [Caerostris darwini]
MGEDRTTCAEKKPNDSIAPPCRHRQSSVISSCSEDAETESTSTGYPQSPDEEREEELEYGPGIVNKLRTRFLSITLKQNRGMNNMRRSCSMENLLDQDRPCNSMEKTLGMVNGNGVQNTRPWGNLKKAKSMDSLLTEMQPETSVKNLHMDTIGEKKVPKIIKNRDNCLSRLCDEELPKPDTVKTYKRMFEPAESRRGSHCRRPPVLRASARSCAASKLNGTATNTSAKVNGVNTKSKYSAKQSPPVKAQTTPDHQSTPTINGNLKKPVQNGESSRPLYNGCHVVKANPVKVNNSNNLRNGKELEKNSINRLLNKKEVHFSTKADVIINGNGCHNEILKIKSNDEVIKQFNNKSTSNNTIVNGSPKPKVPSNRPSIKSPKPLFNKPEDQKLNEKITPPKLKPKLVNGLKKSFEVERKIAPTIPAKTVDERKPKAETKPVESKQQQEETIVAFEDKKSEDAKPVPENNLNGDIQLVPENILTTESKTFVESKPNQLVEIQPIVPKSQEDIMKPLVPQTMERTIQPDYKKCNNKPPQVPPVNIPVKKPENGLSPLLDTDKPKISCKQEIAQQDSEVKRDFKPVKKQKSGQQTTSIVFDFRGKDVVPHVAVLPTPFGCKALHPKKSSKEAPGSNGAASDDEDEDYVDYSVPPPSGVIFEGENVKIGRGSILATRNKDVSNLFTFLFDIPNVIEFMSNFIESTLHHISLFIFRTIRCIL